MKYEQALADWQYLWKISPAYDMTGGYEDQCDLERMLMTPTKRMAAKCLSSQVEYWFQAGPTDDPCGQPYSYDERQAAIVMLIGTDPEVHAIYSRHVF